MKRKSYQPITWRFQISRRWRLAGHFLSLLNRMESFKRKGEVLRQQFVIQIRRRPRRCGIFKDWKRSENCVKALSRKALVSEKLKMFESALNLRFTFPCPYATRALEWRLLTTVPRETLLATANREMKTKRILTKFPGIRQGNPQIRSWDCNF